MNEASFFEWAREQLGSGRVFDDNQRRAIRAGAGPVLIEAGPGSGKTTVMTWRVLYLLRVKAVPPEQICVVTFSAPAARQLKERLADAVDGSDVNFGRLEARTIHSLAWHLLHGAGRLDPARRMVEEEEQLRFVEEMLREQGVDMTDELPREVAGELSAARNRMQRPEEYEPESVKPAVFARVARGYREWKRENDFIDYDDLLVELFVLLRRNAPAVGRRFRHVLVDEFQDTSLLQYELVRMLTDAEGQLYAVGDVDQSIYSWRGAGPQVFLSFEEDYPDTERVVLDRNYRASPSLVETTNRLIENNTRRTPKRIRSSRPEPEREAGPRVVRPQNDAEEARIVADALQRFHAEGGRWGEMAIVYRNNYQSPPFISELFRRGIPFRILGGPPNPFRHWVSTDILAYLKLALGPVDVALLRRIMHRPRRYISRVASLAAAPALARGAGLVAAYENVGLRSFQLARISELERHLGILARLGPEAAVSFIKEDIGYADYLEEQAEEKPGRRAENVAMGALLQTVAGNFDTLPAFIAFAEEARRVAKWWRLLPAQEGVAGGNGIFRSGGASTLRKGGGPGNGSGGGADGAPDENRGSGRGAVDGIDEEDAVTLTTCHSAKGLEFDFVAAVGLVEGVLPGTNGDPEEERRLAYVAMTRARHRLLLSVPKQLFGDERDPSRFAEEASGLDLSQSAAPTGAPAGTAAGGASGTRRDPSRGPLRRSDPDAAAVADFVTEFTPGTDVRHPRFGRGTVKAVARDKGFILIAFDGEEKKLGLDFCIVNPVLKRLA